MIIGRVSWGEVSKNATLKTQLKLTSWTLDYNPLLIWYLVWIAAGINEGGCFGFLDWIALAFCNRRKEGPDNKGYVPNGTFFHQKSFALWVFKNFLRWDTRFGTSSGKNWVFALEQIEGIKPTKLGTKNDKWGSAEGHGAFGINRMLGKKQTGIANKRWLCFVLLYTKI